MARPDPNLPVGGAIAAGALALGAVLTGAATASTARRMTTRRPVRPTAVRAVEGDRIVFRATPDALLPGCYSFWFAEGKGHARVGAVLEAHGDTVVRELLGVDNGDIASARDGRFNGWFLLGPEGLGLPWRSERVQTTQGAVPAWVVPGAPVAGGSVRWAVLVHGRSSVRQETLRAVGVLVAAGVTVLVPAYRGDGEAPPADATRYAVTDAEWVDVESAILHALDGGAEEVVLVGWSSGASIVLATAARSRVRSVVSGMVLDSPVLDGAAALMARGGAAPEPVRRGALSLLAGRWGPLLGADDLDLDPAARADPAELDVPVLVLQSEDDGVAPMSVARGFQAARPELVHLVPFVGARHTRLWNLDHGRWEGAVAALLSGDGARLAALSAAPAASGRRADPSRRAAARRASPPAAAR